jgi:VIT1/CCC1 family predicted Fe2+/Mn2+ transporter
VGLGVALGAGVSMGWSEAGSDTGEETGRGSAAVRGTITGGMTVLGSIFHTLPFLISDVKKALIVAGVVVAVELFVIAWIRNRFLGIPMRSSLVFVATGGLITLAIGVGLGVS